MPELPEVETVKRGLSPVLEGRTITLARTQRPDLRFPFPKNFSRRIINRRVNSVKRRSKYILVQLNSGETLLMHLGMSGRFTITQHAQSSKHKIDFTHKVETKQKHDHVIFHTDDGSVITYNDPRRFGFMTLFKTNQETREKLLKKLGPEPNTSAFTGAYLYTRLGTSKRTIKAGLFDQSVVAGLGNIYICEALWHAKLAPTRVCSDIGQEAYDRLASAINAVIDEAICVGGSTLRDYAKADGSMGYFQHNFEVYGREGLQCHRCNQSYVRRVIQSKRSSFFYPACQS